MDTTTKLNHVLTKSSTQNEIKTYFKKVLELKQSNEQFPVNLDDVWMLVYARRDLAVRALLHSTQFMQDIDYQFFRINAEKSERGRPQEEYHLSVSCLEYFIARKVRPVFEVYRKIFHKTIDDKLGVQHADLLAEVQKWKTMFYETLAIVKSMHESNKSMHKSNKLMHESNKCAYESSKAVRESHKTTQNSFDALFDMMKGGCYA